ncbi:MAG TPA: metalloregulator ArsR/SmtB family transcription factor [Acidimicrobiales bacterium]|nr:metalloregulator ArsR/SmtB family transcription factor [Acidimicrobiales bacterium]
MVQQSATLMRSLSSQAVTDDGVNLLARVFAGISDPTRLRILLVLLDGERNVSELVALVGSSQGRVSTHLSCLRWCGFVTSEQRGKYVYYRVVDPHVRQLIRLAQELMIGHGEHLMSCDVLNRAVVKEASQ